MKTTMAIPTDLWRAFRLACLARNAIPCSWVVTVLVREQLRRWHIEPPPLPADLQAALAQIEQETLHDVPPR